MSLLGKILKGRDNGIRARIKKTVLGEAPATAPAPAPTQAAQSAASASKASLLPEGVSPSAGFDEVMRAEDLPDGEAKQVVVDGVAVCLAHSEGEIHAIGGICPHADGPLGDGELEGRIISCPYHGWTFDVTDGRCAFNEEIRVPRFEVETIEGVVCVKV